MADAITDRTRLLFICNPNNPTGTTNSADEVRRLLERVPDDVLVVVDEAYIEFVERPDYPDLLAELGAGRTQYHSAAHLRQDLRAGRPAPRLRLWRARADRATWSALARPSTSTRWPRLPVWPRWRTTSTSRAAARMPPPAARCSCASCGRSASSRFPSETNFVAVHVGDDMAVTAALMDHGFTINPLSSWGLPGFIRISFGTDDQNARFLEALRTVLRS